MHNLDRILGWVNSAQPAEDLPNGTPPSRWPGVAVRISTGWRAGQIDYRRGVVAAVSDLSISVEMDHPLYRFQKLMGDAYMHYCRNCKLTIPGNVTYQRPAGSIVHKGIEIPIRFFCPYCGPDHLLRMAVPGDKLRLHYRFERDGSAAGWYGEIWEW